MTEIEISTQEIIKLFSEAVKENDLQTISLLLSADGIFEIEDHELKAVESDKKTFINWLSLKLNATTIETIAFDQCMFCVIGNPVVLFNGGKFPITPKDLSERTKTGFMLDIKEDKIVHIKFCSFLLHGENKYGYECMAEKIKEQMNKGDTFEVAYKKIFQIEKLK